jgi:hypothetical protein
MVMTVMTAVSMAARSFLLRSMRFMPVAVFLVAVFTMSTAAAAPTMFRLRFVCAMVPVLGVHGGAMPMLAVVLMFLGLVVVTVSG